MSNLAVLIHAGKELGIEGEALQKWVKEQQALERDKRAEERELEKEKREYQEKLEREKRESQERLEREKRESQERLEREKQELERKKVTNQDKIEREKLQLERERLQMEKDRAEREEKQAQEKKDREEENAKIPQVSLPMFKEGQNKFDAYINRFEQYATMKKWSKSEWPWQLSMLLTGQALDTYYGLSNEQQRKYDDVKGALMRRYSMTEDGFRKELFNTKLGQGETPSQFIARLERLFDNWVDSSQTDKSYERVKSLILREEFLKRCHNHLTAYLREKAEKEVAKVANSAQRYLDAYGGVMGSTGTQKSKVTRESETMDEGEKKCEVCKKTGHMADDCWFKEQKEGTRKCFRCGGADHMVKECPQKKDSVAASAVKTNTTFVENQERSPVQDYRSLAVEEISGLLNVPISKGTVNGNEVLVMRDTGFNFAAVCAKYVKLEQYLHEYEDILLMDCTPRRFQKTKIKVESVYYCGELEVFVVDNPVVDLVFGNVTNQKAGRIEEEYKGTEAIEEGITMTAGTSQEGITMTAGTSQEGNDLGTKDTNVEGSESSDCHKVQNDGAASEQQLVRTSAAVVTRSKDKRKDTKSPLVVPEPESVDRETFKELQREDTKLVKFWKLVGAEVQETKSGKVSYREKNGLLYRLFEPKGKGNTTKQLLVPQKLTPKVVSIAHDGLLSGHFRQKRTLERVMSNFYWKEMADDVARYCRSCDICQKTFQKGRQRKAPLQRMPVMQEPFHRVAIDLVGPIVPSSERGHRYILTVMDYTTRYPEAEALKNIDTISVAEALIGIYCRVGFPKEVLTDQGTQFMSDIMKDGNRLLSIKQLRTTAWHPMCNGLVERFNGTLKTVLKRLCAESPKQWDRYLPAVLFAYRLTTQEMVGFSPFELVFGRKARGPMEILRAYWSQEDQEDEVKTVYQYVVDLRNRLEETCKIAEEELLKTQNKQKKLYDRTAKPKDLKVGEKVLLLLPTKTNKLLLQWRGPFTVAEKLSPVNYKIQMGSKQKNYHVNMLKTYHERQDENPPNHVPKDAGMGQNLSIVAASLVLKDGVGDEADEPELIEVCPLRSTETQKEVTISDELSPTQRTEVERFLERQDDILTTLPGHSELEKHSIKLTSEETIRDQIYPVLYTQREVISEEVDKMLKMGIIRKSKSPYAAPPVLVKKADGSVRFYVNYKRLNAATIFDGEPMPCPDDIYIRMRGKKYRSKLDLTKGYWQISMHPDSVEKTAFVTPNGAYEFLKLPFGLKNSVASFNRLMRVGLGDVKGVGCFVDDVCLFTDTWEEHMELMNLVLGRLREAGLTIRPSKCVIGYGLVEFVGHQVGAETLHPRPEQVKDVLSVGAPSSRREVKAFLAMAGYYAKFIPKFADKTFPLTEMTKKNRTFKWGEAEEHAFLTVKNCLASEPVLKIINFTQDMYVQTDASDVGIGAALLQKYDGIFSPCQVRQ